MIVPMRVERRDNLLTIAERDFYDFVAILVRSSVDVILIRDRKMRVSLAKALKFMKL